MMAPAASHFVSDQTPQVPQELRSLFTVLHKAVPAAHLVGGAVRDLLTGRVPRDIDIVTTGDARRAATAIARATAGHAFALDEPRSQYRVTTDEAEPWRYVDDVDVGQIRDLEEDLARRDFTIDALASELRDGGGLGPVIDGHGGIEDLRAGVVRMVSAANLEDDPLRLLRAVRLATELRFEVEARTAESIRSLALRLGGTAGERQREELVRILSTPRAFQGIQLADRLGLLDVLLPELSPARGVEQPKNHHYYDVFEHSMQALAALDEMLHEGETATGRPWLGPGFREVMSGFDLGGYLDGKTGGVSRLVLLKLATLLHDVAKPESKALQPDGRIRFFGHAELGAAKVRSICERLRFGNRETRFVAVLVEEHLRPTMLAQPGERPSRRALYRFQRDLGEAAPACLILSLADAAGARGPLLQRERWRGHVAYCRYVLYEASRIDSPQQGEGRRRLVNGNDLMTELGLEAGPELGRLLAHLDEAQAVGEIETRTEAVEYARRVMSGETPPPAPSPPAERGDFPAAQGDEGDSGRETKRTPGLKAEKRGEAARPGRERGERWQTPPELWEQLKPFAREHRKEPTAAEKRLWERLRRNQVGGVPFLRQHVIDRFIVDFYCPSAKLVIEVDGPIHDVAVEEDRDRQQTLESMGLLVLRFRNEEVERNLDTVVALISSTVAAAPGDAPSPPAGRGKGEGSPP